MNVNITLDSYSAIRRDANQTIIKLRIFNRKSKAKPCANTGHKTRQLKKETTKNKTFT